MDFGFGQKANVADFGSPAAVGPAHALNHIRVIF
jgi:hypothetical protein